MFLYKAFNIPNGKDQPLLTLMFSINLTLKNVPLVLEHYLKRLGTSLVVQWLRLHASTAGGVQVQSLVGELSSACCIAKKPQKG